MSAPTPTALDALLRQALEGLTRQRQRFEGGRTLDAGACQGALVQLQEWHAGLVRLSEEASQQSLLRTLRAAAARTPQVMALCTNPPRPSADTFMLSSATLMLALAAAAVLELLGQPGIAGQLNSGECFRLASWVTVLLPPATQQLPALAASAAAARDRPRSQMVAHLLAVACTLGSPILRRMQSASLPASHRAAGSAAEGASGLGMAQQAEQQGWRAATWAVVQRRRLLPPFLAACAEAACTLAEAHAELAAVAPHVRWCHDCLALLLGTPGYADLKALIAQEPQLAQRLAALLLAYLRHMLAEAMGGGPGAAAAQQQCDRAAGWVFEPLSPALLQHMVSPPGMAALRGVLGMLHGAPLQPPEGGAAADHMLLLCNAAQMVLQLALSAGCPMYGPQREHAAQQQWKHHAACLVTEALDAAVRPLSAVLDSEGAHLLPLQQQQQQQEQQQEQRGLPVPAAGAVEGGDEAEGALALAKITWCTCCNAAGRWAKTIAASMQQAQVTTQPLPQQQPAEQQQQQQQGLDPHRTPERWMRLTAKLLRVCQAKGGAAEVAYLEQQALLGCAMLAECRFASQPLAIPAEVCTRELLPLSATALKALLVVVQRHGEATTAAAAAVEQPLREEAEQCAEHCSAGAHSLLVVIGWAPGVLTRVPEDSRRAVQCMALEALAAVQALPPTVASRCATKATRLRQAALEVLAPLESPPGSSSAGGASGASSSSGSGSTSSAAAAAQQQEGQQQLARAVEEAHVLALRRCAWLGCTNLSGGSEAELRSQRCGGCLLVRYCSAACQKAAWKQHRAACKALAEQRQG